MVRLLSVVITGPLEGYAEGLSKYLLLLRYARLSVRNMLYAYAHLSRWLGARRLHAGALTADRLFDFLEARRRAGYAFCYGPRALDAAMGYLRGIGAVPVERKVEPRTPLARLSARYAEYLTQERALAASTVRNRVDTMARFIGKDRTRATVRALTSADVSAFLRRLSSSYSPSSLAGIGSNLRCLLRFLFVEGMIGQDLSYAVPSSVGWRDRPLPRGISSEDVRRMLAVCDQRTLVGKRDHAILLLLTRLGLRQCEVCALTLDDLDWERGEVVIHGKGRKRARLPIPDDVGRGISSYLRHRPQVAARRVFLRVHAPYLPLCVIGAPVFSASQRAGLGPVWPHRLRHTAATEMLRGGASLGEIAQVLRHASTSTTSMYAKVDRRALHAVVQPWPGAEK